MNGFSWIAFAIVGVIFAAICYRVAVSKGHNPIGWTIFGFIFPVVTLIVLVLMPDHEDKAA